MASKQSVLSGLSALKDTDPPLYVHPHYKESYRLAIYALLCGGKDAYNDFLQAEQISPFLSEWEIHFILENAEAPLVEEDEGGVEGRRPGGLGVGGELGPSTYFPVESDEEVPDLDLGWPEVALEAQETSISLLFHPPRANTPTIKEVVRKQIQDAKQMVAIAMDVFTDVDIFKEVLGATLRGVAVYILLDEGHFSSFHTMSRRAGVNIQDLKNIRVRTVRGQQYRCQSGVKFHGGLEQRFILVDCRSVLYGTYRYTWSFEKINVSMVLVVTGQLVSSYDEEFRRLYARSTIPVPLQQERSRVEYLRDGTLLGSPNSSQLFLHQIHGRVQGTRGFRGMAQDELLDTSTVMMRGLSVQDRLHLSHIPDHMTRGHSFGGDLQKLNPFTRLRIGTKDIGLPVAPDRTCSSLLVPNRLSHQHIRHQSRYGPDQNLIPFNSETSLHKWKMDTYLNSQINCDGSCDALSPLTTPYSSRTGLNDPQLQGIHNRSRDIKSRVEEARQKRLSLQEYNNLRQSQESLRSMYQTLDRPMFMSSFRGLDRRQNLAQETSSPEVANHRGFDSNQDNSYHSTSYFDIHTSPEQKMTPAHDSYEHLSRTASASHLEEKLKDPSLKYPGSLQRPRTMESLTEIPEEKEGYMNPVNNTEILKEINRNEDKTSKMESSEKKSEPQEGNKSPPYGEETLPKTSTASEVKNHPRVEVTLQRKNSTRMKSSDEKKTSKKEEKSLQRKASRSSKRKQNPQSSRENLQEQEKAVYESQQGKAYSRYESLLRSSVPLDKAKRGDRGHTLGNVAHQTQGGTDNKLGRFMQRVGNLIGKNK
ncbi:protein FAM83B-like [Syngnathoides biaculeatus]|uniref:protein FAM83B-like n=1 Tax=Syngnathoides biaculeatus TaxID=300417 RepID=UPI002ADD86B1|nr:protein FAM83B-like [Syngnathoides biaculeatus]